LFCNNFEVLYFLVLLWRGAGARGDGMAGGCFTDVV